MAHWSKTGKWKRAMIERLMKRDGADCWLCARPMRQPPKRPNKRISLEHPTPRALGGDDSESNLVLCHQHCNAHLRDRPVEQKLMMRRKWHTTERRRRSASSA